MRTFYSRATSAMSQYFSRTNGYKLRKSLKRLNTEIRCLKTRIVVFAKKMRDLVSWPEGGSTSSGGSRP